MLLITFKGGKTPLLLDLEEIEEVLLVDLGIDKVLYTIYED